MRRGCRCRVCAGKQVKAAVTGTSAAAEVQRIEAESATFNTWRSFSFGGIPEPCGRRFKSRYPPVFKSQVLDSALIGWDV